MEIVLGVSMTPTTVRLALVEGEKADGVIVDHDVFDISAIDGSATSRASDHVIDAVLGTQEGAIAGGHHLVSTGVTWTDHAEATELREALIARGIDDVLLVSELHAAAALAKAVGRAVGYDKTGLVFVERDTATLAVVETADGSVVKVLSQCLDGEDAIGVMTEMVTSLDDQEPKAQGIFVVGSGVDVTAVKAQLKDLAAVPVIAPEEPQLALARGAALASANAPRYDASTAGLAYSQDLDGTTAQTVLGHDSSPEAADLASDPDDMPEPSKPFLLVGSSLVALFIAGVLALTIAMVVNVQPTVDQVPNAAPPPPALRIAPPAPPPQLPKSVPDPAAAPPSAAAATARLKIPPAPPPRVFVRSAAPAPAAPPPAPAAPPGLPPPVLIPWLPPILQPPPYYNPRPWNPWPRSGHGDGGHGGRHGHGGGD